MSPNFASAMRLDPDRFPRWSPCPEAVYQPLLEFLHQRFGIPLAILHQFQWVVQNVKTLAIVSMDHQPPQKPEPLAIGIPALKISGAVPKLTTAAARLFGPYACRHTIELGDSNQLRRYLSTARFPLRDDECLACSSSGIVIVRYRGISLGTGFLHYDVPEHLVLQSQFTSSARR